MAAERHADEHTELLSSEGEPLIGVYLVEDGREVTRYFTDERDADSALVHDDEDPLQLAGVWSDLDWDEMEAALARIRNESLPSEPLNP